MNLILITVLQNSSFNELIQLKLRLPILDVL